jgi:hypothetical protein
MKYMRRNLIAFGILVMVVVAGCFQPAGNAGFSHTENPAAVSEQPMGYEPFEVTLYLRDDGENRSVVGPTMKRICGTNIRNFIQVLLLDKSTNKVVEIFEHRRTSDANTGGIIGLYNIELGKTYSILLLQGHWKQDYSRSTADDYKYDETVAPTLLLVGLAPDVEIKPGVTKFRIATYPIWTDTKFISGSTEVEPTLTAYKTTLDQGTWRVQWTVKRDDNSGQNGFGDLETAAQIGGSALFKAVSSVVRIADPGAQLGANLAPTPRISGNTVTLDIDSRYTNGIGRIGTEGSVNFNLKYVPFSLEDSGDWEAKSKYFSAGGIPEWIIRNGINDDTQDHNTDFDKFGKESGKNGNGSLAFLIDGYTETMTLTNGNFVGPASSAAPEITFTAGGYTGVTGAYYVVKEKDAAPPNISEYVTSLDSSLVPGNHTKQITLPSTTRTFDVYVMLRRGKEVSNVLKYNTTVGRFVTLDHQYTRWSDDGGVNWLDKKSGTGGGFFFTGTYGKGKFVVASRDGEIASSGDGKTWQVTKISNNFDWYAITYGDYDGGRFVAVDASIYAHDVQGRIAWSADGINWNVVTLPEKLSLNSISYGNGVFIAIGFVYINNVHTYRSMISGDGGKTWTAGVLDQNLWTARNFIVYNGNMFVGLSNSGHVNVSTDNGAHWTASAQLPLSGTSYAWESLCYGGGRFIAARNDNTIAWSDDAITWNLVAFPGRETMSSNLKKVAYGGGRFLAYGYANIHLSDDGGETWTLAAPGPFSNEGTTLTYGVAP